MPNLVCDLICKPSNEDENEMKINSHYWTDPNILINCQSGIRLSDAHNGSQYSQQTAMPELTVRISWNPY